jgi:serine/threonine protein kinase/tetratricopeptide (TPR) repeat protein
VNERTIFLAVLEIDDPAERSAYLDRACAGDPELRSQVEQLLKAHQEPGRFADRTAPERRAEELATPGKLAETQAETPADDTGFEVLAFLIPSDKPGVLGLLGRYEVLQVIGHGGMGIVLRAFDEHLHRTVAIKVMAAHLATDATARKRFSREARAAAAVSHDHIVTIHAVEEARGLPYLVMKYVAGVTLKQRLDREGPLPLPEILRIGMETASGLAAAHAQGLIHRDIKPANILLEGEPGASTTGGRVKITDFGLARAADDSSLTQSGVVAGTPDYMSPEQALGEALDARTDLFSLGSVLYALCTGRPPFRAGDTMAILHRVCEEAPTPIRAINPEIPDWLVAIIDKLHAKDPGQRFQSAAEVAELLSRHLAHLLNPPVAPLSSHSPSGGPKAPADGALLARKRRRAVAVTLLVLFLGGLALTEATGVTKLTATAIRVFTPDGTPFVEGNDPGVEGADKRVSKDRPETELPTAVAPVKAEPGWVPLFNGKDLAGWKPDPNWRVEEGIIIGAGPTKLHALLVTERNDYQDFHLRVEARVLTEECDSGVFFRVDPGSWDSFREANIAFPPGNPERQTGSLVVQKSKSDEKRWISAPPGLAKPNEWLTLEVIVRGPHWITKVNGRTAVETYEVGGRPRGHILLQQHGPQTVVHFRKIEIKELVTSPDQAVELAEKALEKEPNSGVVLASLGAAYYRAGRWRDAIRTLTKADEAGHGANVSFSPFVLAMAHWQAGDQEKARQWYGLGLVWLARQAAPAEELLRVRAEAASLLGMPEQLSAEQAEAKADWLKYLDLVVKTHPEAVWAYEHRGRAYAARRQWAEAEADYRRGVALFEEGATDFPTRLTQARALAQAHLDLGALFLKANRKEEAAAAYRQVVTIQETLETHWAGKSESRRPLAQSHFEVATLLKQARQPQEAVKLYRRAVEHSEKLVADHPKDVSIRWEVALRHQDLAEVLLYHLSEAEEAARSRQRQVAVFEQLVTDSPRNPGTREQLGHSYRWRAFDLERMKQPRQAEQAFGQAIEYLEQLVGDFPESPGYRAMLADTYDRLRQLLAASGKPQEAATAFDKTIRALEGFPAERATTPPVRAGLSDLHFRRGNLLRDAQRLDDAEAAYRQAIDVQTNLVAEHPRERSYRHELGRYHNWLGIVLGQNGRPQEAEQAHRQAFDIYEKLTEETDPSASHWHRRELAWTCLNLGEALEKDRRFAEAMELDRRAGELCEKLAAENPDGTYPFWGSQGYGKLTVLLAAADRAQEAEQACRKVLELQPDAAPAHFKYALLRLHLGGRDAHRTACAAMLTRFGNSPDLDAAYWTAWTCTLGPDAVSDWQPVVRLAEKALAADRKNCDKLQLLGAVLYRAGRFEEALKRLTEAEAAFQEARNPLSTVIYNWLFQAMTRHRLGQADEARKWLEKAVEAIDRPPEKSKDANAGVWNRRLTLQLWQREAQTQLGKGDSR